MSSNKIRASITGVHGYVPDYILSNSELEKLVDTSDEWIVTRTGIKERRILKGDMKGTSIIGTKCVEGLLEKTGTSANDIDLIICATVTPDMFFPSTANLIANNKALYASKENVTKVEKIKSELSKKDNEKKQEAKRISEKINKKEYKIEKLCTENNELYGSVKPTEISKLIKEIDNQGIKPSMIQPIKDIKTIGKFKVKISLHSEVDAEIIINVVSSETIQ